VKGFMVTVLWPAASRLYPAPALNSDGTG